MDARNIDLMMRMLPRTSPDVSRRDFLRTAAAGAAGAAGALATPKRARAPCAISMTVSSLTAPCLVSVSFLTPSRSVLVA